MPAMDGLAILREAQVRPPGVPAILLTGFATDAADLVIEIGGTENLEARSGFSPSVASTAAWTDAVSRSIACSPTAVINALLVAKWRKGAPDDTPASSAPTLPRFSRKARHRALDCDQR
jgi:hypothetical protein